MGLDMSMFTPDGDEMAWGKRACMIHRWLSDKKEQETGEHITECGDYEFPSRDLAELADVCQQVLDNPSKAEELLPSNYEYDDAYFDELRRTRDFLRAAVDAYGDDAWFDYWVSW
jgi:hypothetical protein